CGDYARVLHLNFAREASGAAGTRHSLRPLFCWANVFAKLGRIAPRDSGLMLELTRRHCEERLVRRSSTSEGGSEEAIHSSLVAPWIASRSLSSGAHSRDPLARNDDKTTQARHRSAGRRVADAGT